MTCHAMLRIIIYMLSVPVPHAANATFWTKPRTPPSLTCRNLGPRLETSVDSPCDAARPGQTCLRGAFTMYSYFILYPHVERHAQHEAMYFCGNMPRVAGLGRKSEYSSSGIL